MFHLGEEELFLPPSQPRSKRDMTMHGSLNLKRSYLNFTSLVPNNDAQIRSDVMDAIHSGKIPQEDIAYVPIKYLDKSNLPGVPSQNIMTASKAYKPFRYNFGFETWEKQNKILWLPDQIPMTDDIRDWKSKLSDDERRLMTNIFPLFVQNDVMVNNVYVHHYGKLFLPNEIQMAISAIANAESVHQAAYAHLLDSLSFPVETYSEFLHYKEMSDKYNYTQGFDTNTLMGIAVAMVVFGGMTEGLQLFATFAIMLNFPRRNMLKGMGQVVSWSVRDESLHVAFVSKIFKYFMMEYGHLIDKDTLRLAINKATRDIVSFEDAFTDMAFGTGHIEGMTKEEHKTYIRSIADMRLKQFGFESIFGEPENPYDWIDVMIGGMELGNFFETRPTDYARNSTQGTWEDAWASIIKTQ